MKNPLKNGYEKPWKTHRKFQMQIIKITTNRPPNIFQIAHIEHNFIIDFAFYYIFYYFGKRRRFFDKLKWTFCCCCNWWVMINFPLFEFRLVLINISGVFPFFPLIRNYDERWRKWFSTSDEKKNLKKSIWEKTYDFQGFFGIVETPGCLQ